MTRLILSIFCFTLCLGCGSGRPSDPRPTAPTSVNETDAPQIEEVRPGVWVHTTSREVEGFGQVPSNGLAVASTGEALLVDAGWNDDPEEATGAIMAEIRRQSGSPVRRAVMTHHHDDSVAGIAALRRARVPSYTTTLTADLMAAKGWGRPDSLLRGGIGDVWVLGVGEHHVEVFYPGPGHTADNVVVFVPHARVLYTGCLVRPGGTDSLGNTADADMEEWAVSVARVRARYGDRVDLVVPSHGPPAGPELLDHTIALVETHRGSSSEK